MTENSHIQKRMQEIATKKAPPEKTINDQNREIRMKAKQLESIDELDKSVEIS